MVGTLTFCLGSVHFRSTKRKQSALSSQIQVCSLRLVMFSDLIWFIIVCTETNFILIEIPLEFIRFEVPRRELIFDLVTETPSGTDTTAAISMRCSVYTEPPAASLS